MRGPLLYSPDIEPLDFHSFRSLQNSLNGKKISIPWKTVKGTWNSSLLKKIKSLGKVMEQNGAYDVQ